MKGKMTHRSGVSLTEVLVAMSLGILLMSMATQAVHRVFRYDSNTRGAMVFQTMSQRVAARFRRDVRASQACEEVGGGLRLQMAESSIVYQANGNVVSREDSPKNDRLAIHRDEFVLPENCQCVLGLLKRRDGFVRPLARLSIVVDDGAVGMSDRGNLTGVAPKSLLIEAVVGRLAVDASREGGEESDREQ